MKSIRAISLFVNPCAIRSITSCSRFDRSIARLYGDASGTPQRRARDASCERVRTRLRTSCLCGSLASFSRSGGCARIATMTGSHTSAADANSKSASSAEEVARPRCATASAAKAAAFTSTIPVRLRAIDASSRAPRWLSPTARARARVATYSPYVMAGAASQDSRTTSRASLERFCARRILARRARALSSLWRSACMVAFSSTDRNSESASEKLRTPKAAAAYVMRRWGKVKVSWYCSASASAVAAVDAASSYRPCKTRM